MNCIIHLIFDGLSTAGSNNGTSLLRLKSSLLGDKNISTWCQEHLYLTAKTSLLGTRSSLLGGKNSSTWEFKVNSSVKSNTSFYLERTIIHPLDLVMSSIQGGTNVLLSDKAHTGLFHKEPSFIFNERNVIGSSLYELEYQITGTCSQIPLEDELGCARLCEGVYISHSGRATSDAMAGNSSSTTGLSLGCLGTPGTFLPLLGFLFGTVDLARLQAFGYRISKLLKRNIGISQVQIAFFQVTRSPPQYA
ncbi:hypothetical protein BDB01DRAFT_900426 [Pilobolus umbonatus]|nr:hypothetical protein BDB01DRAFT_900426 [Pilobolus umbonatus]